jgi:hypothetical protein
MRLVLALALLSAASSALAQTAQTPSAPPSTQATPPASAAPDPAHADKEAAAAKAASEWLVLIDKGQYAKAWEACSPLFRDKVTKQQWVEGIPKNRAEYGAFRARKVTATAYRQSLPGAPEGEYVSVRFSSDYEKKSDAEETVALVLQGGAWRPIGYLLR